MASTYSPSLRIELIGAGEQAGTWNTTTNTNLGTLIESAIAGYVSVSVTSANQAFTALDGAPDQSRNAVIALTTTTTADFAVYAPPQEKQYIIWNTTAYTATIYNSTVLGNTTAAGLGVAVTAGKKLVVFTTGTNFYTIETPDQPLVGAQEAVTISASAASGTVNLSVLSASVLYYQGSATGNWTLNVRGSGSITLDSTMSVGTSVTVAFLNTNGATAYRQTGFTVDGVAVTPKWQGGVAPTSANANSIDAYTATILKTAPSTFVVLESQTGFA